MMARLVPVYLYAGLLVSVLYMHYSTANVVQQLLEPNGDNVPENQDLNEEPQKIQLQQINAHGAPNVQLEELPEGGNPKYNGGKSSLPFKNRAGTNMFVNNNKVAQNTADINEGGGSKRSKTGADFLKKDILKNSKSGVASFLTVKPLDSEAYGDLNIKRDSEKLMLPVDQQSQSRYNNKQKLVRPTGVLNSYEGQMKVLKKDDGKTYDGGGGNTGVKSVQNQDVHNLGQFQETQKGEKDRLVLDKNLDQQQRLDVQGVAKGVQDSAKQDDNREYSNQLDRGLQVPVQQIQKQDETLNIEGNYAQQNSRNDGINLSSRQKNDRNSFDLNNGNSQNVQNSVKPETVLRFDNQENNGEGYQDKSTRKKKKVPTATLR